MARLGVLTLVLALAVWETRAGLHLASLYSYVTSRHPPGIVPVQEDGAAVAVSVVFQPINVARVDEASNSVEVEAVVRLAWDSAVAWDPGPHGFNASYVTVPKDAVWRPTLSPVGAATQLLDRAPPVVTLFHNGTAVWFAAYRARFWCDVTRVATGAECALTLANWGYSKDRVAFRDLDSGSMQFVMYFAGSRYEIVDHGVSVTEFPTDGRVYQFASFHMTIREKPGLRPSVGPFRAFFQWD